MFCFDFDRCDAYVRMVDDYAIWRRAECASASQPQISRGVTMMMGSPAAQAAGLDCQPGGHGVGFDGHTNMSLI